MNDDELNVFPFPAEFCWNALPVPVKFRWNVVPVLVLAQRSRRQARNSIAVKCFFLLRFKGHSSQKGRGPRVKRKFGLESDVPLVTVVEVGVGVGVGSGGFPAAFEFLNLTSLSLSKRNGDACNVKRQTSINKANYIKHHGQYLFYFNI